ncbi:MAG: tetratricopeptide repeat protein [Planctomycetaceae bacterium]|nr:tetratricopeptide repeat protein [Planctomycetaceae bacterium]
MWLTLSLLVTGCSVSKFVRRHRAESCEQLAEQARAAANRGDAASAESLLTAAVNRNPRDCEVRLELSEMLLEHGSLSAATEHLRRLVEQNPDDPRANLRLARTLYLQDDYSGAVELVDQVIEIDPENPQAWMLRAKIDNRNGNDCDALAACYRVLAAAPEDAEARLLAAEIHLHQDNSQQASPLLRSLLDSASCCPQQRAAAAWLLGGCYAQEGRWGDAAATLSSAIGTRPLTVADWYQLAYARYRAGDLEASRGAVDTALRMSPDDPQSLALSRLLEATAVRTAAATLDQSASTAPAAVLLPAASNTVVPADRIATAQP